MFLDIVDDVRAFGSPFGDDDDAAQFLHAVRFFQMLAEGLKIDFMFRNQDGFGTGSHAGIEGDKAGFAAHNFNDGDAVMGKGRITDLIDRFENRIDSRIEPQGILRPDHIVVDGPGNGNRREPEAGQASAPRMEPSPPMTTKASISSFRKYSAAFCCVSFSFKFQAAGCPKYSPPMMNDRADIASA